MSELVVQTKDGRIQGILENGVRVWKGIPYAKPPIGPLRFRAPAAPEPWDGIKDTTAFSPMCLQPLESTSSMLGGGVTKTVSEDCLYLNVWAPRNAPAEPLPVMVWIHGGTFVTGSGSLPSYDGSAFVLRGSVIMVTINYRLGPLGFLHLAPFGESYASNTGLLDQIAALQWVQDNIGGFGGDPDRVTVFGESAGSMSIAALLAMPAAKGLFHRAIMESGAAQVITSEEAQMITAGLLKELDIPRAEMHRLESLTGEQIFEAGERLKKRVGPGVSMLFQPVLDPDTLPQDPLQAVQEGSAKDVPILIGTNLDEGALFFRPDMPLVKERDLVHVVERMTGIPDAAPLTKDYPYTIDGHAQIMTDLYFWRSALQFASAQIGHAPVWMYRFDWTLPNHPILGKAMHALEIPFVFNTLALFRNIGVQVDAQTQALSDRMQDAWIAFARGGSPDTEGLPWPTYEPASRSTMIFNSDCSIIEDPDAVKRMNMGL
ncbi:carboxylesterase/lipase family protein [Paenibacillus glucanolyticus]|uniref:Carboxylic ester hydrolase n=2 Tax=Paenibacillus glucanolyticus TaxID=59843 RepID=A0A163JYE7_9BACL|nr:MULTISPECIES: carboxylesterase/lipase family protein [Paenibacillus]AWP29663.1 para-nitrobenzyl esterase [Paenibacillus sp. Cedars]KZS46873.1 para-nitrobenzyl esterase [Paenibacillus glucanolyticus]MDH6673282.1 para-nitrobenzyl esterase [Paenibacillus sp. LBL]MPY15366.1 carboxylesterase/lipase family protein [Paenibacillus glucanolyticus]